MLRENVPLMYSDLAEWWPLLSSPNDYEEEAGWYRDALADVTEGALVDVLELGSGGGNNASFLKKWFNLTLVDIAPEMLRVSEALNPECEHVNGDMREVRLNRAFDGVLIHDAISYMTTPTDLAAAIHTAAVHCRSDGGAVFVPDFVRETFKPQTTCGGHDAPEGRGFRYMAWQYDPDPEDTRVTVDYAFLVRDVSGETRVFQDRHTLGIFPKRLWMNVLLEAGFEARAQDFKPDVDHETVLFSGRLLGTS